MSIDLATAEEHGVCPVCEGYGGRPDDDACQAEDSTCPGSCPQCWCPGCHDGQDVAFDEDLDEHPMGSWRAYQQHSGAAA